MSRCSVLWRACSTVLAWAVLAAPPRTGAADDPRPPDAPRKQLALLVGCTRYPENDQVRELWGPANDVPRLAELLHKHFDFPEANITELVGWPDDAARRPTSANIAAAFKDLISKADADTQIVILLSGHGVRIPIADPSKAQNWKANHLAFLPADVASWKGDTVENSLPDDQILDWLDQLRKKGASVLMLFDCCHAGSVVRGDSVERARTVRPQDLGIPDKVLEQSVAKARAGAQKDPAPGERTRGLPELLPSGLGLDRSAPGQGSVTAFFACQPFEEAPELPRPEGAAQTQDNYYGLLTFTLTKALNEQGKQLTYRELAHVLTSQYKAERGSRGPTPLVEGDLDREVLGLKRWPGRSSIVLQKHADKMQITAGALMGVTTGSVLGVHPPPGQPGGDKTLLGYVRVAAVTPGQADVEPCPRDKEPAVAADKLPEGAVCTLVERALGDMRVKLAVAKSVAADASDAGKKRAANLAAALDGLPSDAKDLICMVPDEAAADWVLGTDGDKVVLWQGVGAPIDPTRIEQNAEELKALGQPAPRHAFGGYPIADDSDVKALTGSLQMDIHKVFTWQSLWRVAGASEASASGADAELKFEVIPLMEGDKPGEPLPPGAVVTSGQRTLLRLTNNSQEDLYVTLVSLDANLGISVLTRSLRHGESMNKTGTIRSQTFGREGMVVLVLPQSASKEEPRYDFLEQDPLHDYKRGGDEHTKAADLAPQTPFGQLMKTAATGKGTRGFDPDAPTNPLVLSRSWTTVPKAP